MTSEYNAAQRLLHKIKQNVSDFDLSEGDNNKAAVQGAIAVDLQTLEKRIGEYRILGRQEGNERKRKMMLERASAMTDEHSQLGRRFEKMKQLKTERQENAQNRAELFQRNPTAGTREPMDTAIDMGVQNEEAFWDRSENALDGFIAQGLASLESLREQRGFLDNARRRILNADSTLGLSRTVITYINRRTTQDKIILVAGMVATCFGIYLIIHYLG
ncbi:protein transport protein bos1 [Coemansia sp. RSA 1813]|nr:protein transport protein bos1 [Coemansia sp. RSA 1646]KAJ1770054.1 protein transport protein bos1 [Coemansia sp. RSA 1843]KAJ2087444.1 protein transport protein bos1 [Coemansia sp. RSA 986]KAJ2212434.1 protein transport protein bos1 [Coemansia sp. RSA 487]KAJ2566396.1 protein transport protein bos1 [Coemansia sp. RSA 1813]